ncbi:MAG: ASKHA domain-containing protein [Desulfarculaceae bacterium]|nr:ASKHA domain-containing protein [Desulfarculaceae bacterium]MCF8071887.1 ASKHA domain-containing protein [Desulfarculaceae bacterium]MCF8101437.1 ASKHA domain-containing protein [Desulfarculaceae bacterium]MCF8114954.1 ASKHA domain-containing protein [Desulfarculaceae bacterium]
MKVRFEPFGVEVESQAGDRLLDLALEAGVHINASCGGEGVCGKCRINVEEGSVEGGLSEKISAEDAEAGVRLACQSTIIEDVTVRIPVQSGMDKVGLNALAAGSAQVAKLIGSEELKAEGRFDPSLSKLMVSAPPPSLEDNRNDVARLLSALKQAGENHFVFDFEAIRDLPSAWRDGEWNVTTTINRPVDPTKGRNHVIRVEPGDTTSKNLAVAIDLGTTTVWAQLLDLHTGEIVGTEGDFNGQISFGEDVISRIVYAAKPGGMEKLHKAAADSINKVLGQLSKRTGVDFSEVSLATLAGNTTMTQLFLGVEPKWLRLEPYVPSAAYYPPVKAADFGLDLPDHVSTLVFPSVASYVGGDVVAGVMGVGMHRSEALTLFIDMGTNGEVVVGNQDWMACAAASAGPAFEGGGIKFGMRAARGAIENFSVDPFTGEPALITVGHAKPRGICGSGLIAIVASLLMSGIIDERGRFNIDHPSDRLREGEDGPEYVLAWAKDTAIDRDLALTEPDVDNLMRAKAAMYAAYMTLLEGVGLTIHDLERVILAGGFGQSINLERAILIGLLPELPLDKYTFVGNGSLLGCRLVAMSNPLRAEVGGIVDQMTNFELSVAPGYMDNYTGSQFLPHTEAKTLFPETYRRLNEAKAALKEAAA